MRTYLGYIASLLLLGMGACNPCKDHVDVYYTSEEIKPYLFKTGTYWVYEEQTTGKIDSQTVYFHKYELGVLGIHPDKCGSTYEERYIYSVYDTVIGVSAKKYHYHNNASLTISGLTISGINLNNSYDAWPIYISNFEIGDSNMRAKLIQRPLSVTINSVLFNDVSVFRIDTSSQMEYVTDYFWSPHIGVIRRIEYDTPDGNLTWDLINKNIVQ